MQEHLYRKRRDGPSFQRALTRYLIFTFIARSLSACSWNGLAADARACLGVQRWLATDLERPFFRTAFFPCKRDDRRCQSPPKGIYATKAFLRDILTAGRFGQERMFVGVCYAGA